MPIVNLWVCDDIRQEIGGKKTFVGVYFGGIHVGAFPFRFPVLVFFIELQKVKNINKIELNITPPKSKPNHLEININKALTTIFVEARVENFVVPEPGDIDIEIIGEVKGEKNPWTHKLTIPVKEVPKPE